MDVGKPTTLDAIIQALVLRIATETDIAESNIIPSLSKDWFDPGGLADKFVIITNFNGASIEGHETGGGNDAKAYACSLDLCLYARLDVDTPGRDLQRIANTSYGLLPVWLSIQNAVSQWMPDDGEATPQGLLMEPARLDGFVIKPRNFRGASGWVELMTRLSFPFMQSLA